MAIGWGWHIECTHWPVTESRSRADVGKREKLVRRKVQTRVNIAGGTQSSAGQSLVGRGHLLSCFLLDPLRSNVIEMP